MPQQTFTEVTFEQYRKPTRREQLPNEMNRVVPWTELVTVIESMYPKADRPRRPPVGIGRKLSSVVNSGRLNDSLMPPAVHDRAQWRIPDGFPTRTRPGVVILDLETKHDAIDTISQIRESTPTSKIVLLCGFEDQPHTREMFAAGVDGIITVQPPTIMLAVIEVPYAPAQAYGEQDGTVGLSLGPPVKKKSTTDAPPQAWPNASTKPEREIVRLVGKGLSNKDIACQLSISDSTIRHHMTNIFEKVGVPNRQNLLIHTYQFRSMPI